MPLDRVPVFDRTKEAWVARLQVLVSQWPGNDDHDRVPMGTGYFGEDSSISTF